MWENIKFFSTLISALVTADIVLFNLLLNAKALTGSPVLALFFLPALVVLLSIFGRRDLKRRWSRILEAIANTAKMESLLGLYEPLPQQDVFPKDKYLYPERWFQSRRKYESTEKFVEGEMKMPNMYTHMGVIYYFMAAIGFLLAILPVGFSLLGI